MFLHDVAHAKTTPKFLAFLDVQLAQAQPQLGCNATVNYSIAMGKILDPAIYISVCVRLCMELRCSLSGLPLLITIHHEQNALQLRLFSCYIPKKALTS